MRVVEDVDDAVAAAGRTSIIDPNVADRVCPRASSTSAVDEDDARAASARAPEQRSVERRHAGHPRVVTAVRHRRRRRSWPSPSSSGVMVAGSALADQPAAEHHARACRTGRSARPGRRRSAARPGPRGGPRGSGPRSRPARRRPRRGSGGRRSAASASRLISRPTISFCWLPPDSERGGTSMPGVRTSYSLDDPLRCRARAPPDVEQAALDVGRLGSGGRGSGSPTAAPRAAGRGGGGPRGCSRCRPRGARGSTSVGDVVAVEQ